ncbi:PulJ/GspJ family protein [Thomasclavelia cocleata]|uniref:PulJ/GspJ family protein n=3 Tax=Thomasclavelia cocleata TaxID=69824 RepID=UPI0024327D61|nr:type II secretion system protein [Thomasclavelia cocleata]
MLKNKGMTLIESLLAFSIFITIVVVIFSGYTSGLKYYQKDNESYERYIEFQNDKELNLWQTNDLSTSINEVLH